MARPAAGSILSGAVRLVLRHWIILLVGMLVLAEATLLNLSILGRCFGAFSPSCPSFVMALGYRAEWLVSSVLNEATGFVIAAVAIYFLYSSARVDLPGAAALRTSRRRGFRLFARLGVMWIVILLPIYLFDIALTLGALAFPALEFSPLALWLTYIGRTLAIVIFSGYLHARLVFYLPAAAYSDAPESWQDGWRRTKGHGRRLFIVFFLIGFVASLAQVGIMALAFHLPAYQAAADAVSAFLDVRSSYMLRNLVQGVVFVLIGSPGTLIEAAASLVAFKILTPAEEQATAYIFS